MNGYATSSSTANYLKKHSTISSSILGKTGLMVSDIGYGTYRVGAHDPEHKASLKKALREGVNIIDTSANYMDGAAEEIIGDCLNDLIETNELSRDEVVVVSKGGYIQGQQYVESQERKKKGDAYTDLVVYQEGLEHCLHPTFLADQIQGSLHRLDCSAIDVYLLHNPEYFLMHAAKEGMDLTEAREEYYRRIKLAFEHLETEVEAGNIKWYGVSSNTFPSESNHPHFTSLSTLLEIASSISESHHFAVVQCPMNLFENNAAICKNQPQGQTFLDVARQCEMGVLINRPLNAIVNQTLVRLAVCDEQEEFSVLEVEDRLSACQLAESQFLEALKNSEEDLSMSDYLFFSELNQLWQQKPDVFRFKDILTYYVVPKIEKGLESILNQTTQETYHRYYYDYVQHINSVIQSIHAYLTNQHNQQCYDIRDYVVSQVPQWETPYKLSLVALRALRSTEGVSSVLVGMRRQSYVEDVLSDQLIEKLGHQVTEWKQMSDINLHYVEK